jgi:hypothetical protein
MPTYIEIFMYSAILGGAIFTSIISIYAGRKFLKGDFKRFINWVIIAIVSFTTGMLFLVITTIFESSPYTQIFVILTGITLLVTSACFVKVATILLELSDIYGFSMEKDFSHKKKKKE